MDELIPFSQIDPYDDGDWTPEQLEAAEFLHKMDHEGGISGLIGYGGYQVFPKDLQLLAARAEVALENLREAVNKWANDRGVSY